MSSSGEGEIDYPESPREIADSPLSLDEYTASETSQPENEEYKRTRNNIYYKNTPAPRKHRVADENNPALTHPTTKLPNQPITEQTHQIQNRFTPISNSQNEIEETNNQEQEETEDYQDANDNTKTSKPPPIIIRQTMPANKAFKTLLIDTLHRGFEIKRGKDNTAVHANNQGEYENLKRLLKEKGYQYHTYTPRQDRTHAFVLAGLEVDVEIDEIIEELTKKYKIPVRRIIQLNRTKTPLFMVVTNIDQTLKKLQKTAPIINYTRIIWKRYENNRVSTQCRNCQQWGHATTNCNANPRCVKCAGHHSTRQCTLTYAEKPKCVNCNGEHTACNINCPVYQKIANDVERRLQKTNIQTARSYVPAPQPTINVWQRKAETEQPRINTNNTTQEPTRQEIYASNFPPMPNIYQRRKNAQQLKSRNAAGDAQTTEERRLENAAGDDQIPERRRVENAAGDDHIQEENQARSEHTIHQGERESRPESRQEDTEMQGIDKLGELHTQLHRLEELVDLDKLIHYLKTLNDKLSTATTSSRKFEIMLQLYRNIDKYGL